MSVVDVPTPEAFEREVLRAAEPTVVLFTASWCPFCRAFGPLFERSATRSSARFAVVSLDDESNPLWDAYDVQIVPSLAYFRDGALVRRKDGRRRIGLSEAELAAFLREALPPAPAP